MTQRSFRQPATCSCTGGLPVRNFDVFRVDFARVRVLELRARVRELAGGRDCAFLARPGSPRRFPRVSLKTVRVPGPGALRQVALELDSADFECVRVLGLRTRVRELAAARDCAFSARTGSSRRTRTSGVPCAGPLPPDASFGVYARDFACARLRGRRARVRGLAAGRDCVVPSRFPRMASQSIGADFRPLAAQGSFSLV